MAKTKTKQYRQFSDCPAWVSQRKKVSKAAGDVQRIDREIQQLARREADPGEALSEAVDAYESTGVATATPNIAQDTSVQLSDLRARRRVVEASRLRNAKELKRLENSLCKELLAERRPDLNKLTAAVADAFDALADTQDALRTFRGQMAQDNLAPASGSAWSAYHDIRHTRKHATEIRKQIK